MQLQRAHMLMLYRAIHSWNGVLTTEQPRPQLSWLPPVFKVGCLSTPPMIGGLSRLYARALIGWTGTN